MYVYMYVHVVCTFFFLMNEKLVYCIIIKNTCKRENFRVDEMFDSMFTRSTAVGACPHEDLAPLIDWMADRIREKPRRQRSQHNVLL